MKKTKKNSLIKEVDFPCNKEKNHVYNLLAEFGVGEIDTGTYKYKFELLHGLKDEDVYCDGLTSFADFTIKLELALSNDLAIETIIHEVLHCMLYELGLHEEHFDGKHFLTTNESIIQALGKQFLKLYKLNPSFMGILFYDQ